MEEYLEKKWWSSVPSSLLRKALWKGYGWAGAGALLLLSLGTQIKTSLPFPINIILFFLAFFCISMGLYPYKKLNQLAEHPHQLRCNFQNLELFSKGKLLLSLPLMGIQKVIYVENEQKRGMFIAVDWTKLKTCSQVVISEDIFYLPPEEKEYGLLLSFFSERSCLELNDILL